MNSAPQGQKPKKKLIIAIIACVLVVALLIPTAIFLIPKLSDKNDTAETTDVPGTEENPTESLVNAYSPKETEKIEKKLISAEQEDDHVNMVLEKGSALESLKTGDVFLLQGDEESAFGELYFGKVESIAEEDGKCVCKVVTPKFDEVFDSIELADTETELGFDNIVDVATAEGVTISRINSTNETRGHSTSSSMPLSATDITHTYQNGGIAVDFEVDILKLLKESGKIKTTSTTAQRVTEADKAKTMTVYYTDTGVCYHLETCFCLAKSKHATDLDTAVTDMNFRACQICQPPVLTYDDLGEKITSEAKLTLKGKVALENLGIGILGGKGKEWSVKDGFENLSLKTYGNITANATLQGNFDMELSGTSTRQVLWGDESDPSLYLDGLNEKLLPIAFFKWDGGTFSVRTGPSSDKVSGVFTIGVMIYTDMQGNIKAGTTFTCSYNRSLEYQMDIFRNGEFVALTDNGMANAENNASFTASLKAELEAHGDLQAFNASVMLYIGNVNVLEFALVKLGIEGEGKLAFDSTTWDEGNHGLTAEAKVTVYAELFDLAIKMQYNKWFGEWTEDPDPLCRWDIATFEVKTPTSEDPGSEPSTDEPTTGEPSTEEPTTGEPSTGEPSTGDPDPDVHIHSYGADDKCELCGDAYEDIGLVFALDGDTYCVSKYNGTATEVTVPLKYRGKSVATIGNNAFSSCGGLTKVILGKNITKIGNYAFSECRNLSEINLPSALLEIGRYAFQNCTQLKQIVIPKSVTSLQDHAFVSCSGLTDVVIGESVTTVGEGAFENCIGLTSLTIQDGVKKIDRYAFYKCNALKTVILSNSIATVGYSSFASCGNLTKVTLGNVVTEIGSYAFSSCGNLTEINLPSTLLTIGSYAFQKCTRLQEIVIPKSVTSLQDHAFASCSGLTGVVIGESVTTVGEGAFENCIGLTSLTIQDGVKKIDRYAFHKCNALKTVTLPNSITTVDYYSFGSCGNLTKVTLGNGVTEIGSYAFSECGNLTEINLPSALLTIGRYAFQKCTQLKQIVIPDRVTSLQDHAFASCSGLIGVVIGESVTTIGESAFASCTALTSLTIKEGVKKIDSYAFGSCNALKTVILPTSVTIVGYSSFSSCGNLTKVTLGNSVTEIGNYAFSSCGNLTEINLPEGLLTIGEYAFNNCTNLQTITIPNSVSRIAYRAFVGCSKLSTIKFNGTKETWSLISKGSYWNYAVPATEVICTNGSVALS